MRIPGAASDVRFRVPTYAYESMGPSGSLDRLDRVA